MKDIIQSNDAAYQTCAVSSSIKMSDDLASTIINRSSVVAKQKTTGLNLTLVLIILGSIALLISEILIMVFQLITGYKNSNQTQPSKFK